MSSASGRLRSKRSLDEAEKRDNEGAEALMGSGTSVEKADQTSEELALNASIAAPAQGTGTGAATIDDCAVSTPKNNPKVAGANTAADNFMDRNKKFEGLYGEVVWVLMKSYPPWPAYICDPGRLPANSTHPSVLAKATRECDPSARLRKHCTYFYGSHDFNFPSDSILRSPYSDYREEFASKKLAKRYEQLFEVALREADADVAKEKDQRAQILLHPEGESSSDEEAAAADESEEGGKEVKGQQKNQKSQKKRKQIEQQREKEKKVKVRGREKQIAAIEDSDDESATPATESQGPSHKKRKYKRKVSAVTSSDHDEVEKHASEKPSAADEAAVALAASESESSDDNSSSASSSSRDSPAEKRKKKAKPHKKSSSQRRPTAAVATDEAATGRGANKRRRLTKASYAEAPSEDSDNVGSAADEAEKSAATDDKNRPKKAAGAVREKKNGAAAKSRKQQKDSADTVDKKIAEAAVKKENMQSNAQSRETRLQRLYKMLLDASGKYDVDFSIRVLNRFAELNLTWAEIRAENGKIGKLVRKLAREGDSKVQAVAEPLFQSWRALAGNGKDSAESEANSASTATSDASKQLTGGAGAALVQSSASGDSRAISNKISTAGGADDEASAFAADAQQGLDASRKQEESQASRAQSLLSPRPVVMDIRRKRAIRLLQETVPWHVLPVHFNLTNTSDSGGVGEKFDGVAADWATLLEAAVAESFPGLRSQYFECITRLAFFLQDNENELQPLCSAVKATNEQAADVFKVGDDGFAANEEFSSFQAYITEKVPLFN